MELLHCSDPLASLSGTQFPYLGAFESGFGFLVLVILGFRDIPPNPNQNTKAPTLSPYNRP